MNLPENLFKKTHLRFGHIGVKQLELTLLPNFYNESLKKFILEFKKTCFTCIRNKSQISPKFGQMSHLVPATKPFEYMSVDIIGGFSGNNSTKRYIHLLVDHFTRFAYTITSKHQKAPDFIKLLNLAIQKGNNIQIFLPINIPV